MKRIALLVAIVALCVLGLAGTAYAATPQDIYDDYATDRDLDGQYTDEELQAYLDDATVHQYGDDAVLDELDRLATDMLSGEPTDDDTRPSFPFTGAELALVLLGAMGLLAGGIVLRRSAVR